MKYHEIRNILESFYDPDHTSPTPITCLVGNNGSGKSRTLEQICDLWLQNNKVTEIVFKNKFEKVVVISNVITDPFIRNKPSPTYEYRGARTASNVIDTGVFERIVTNAEISARESESFSKDLRGIYKMAEKESPVLTARIGRSSAFKQFMKGVHGYAWRWESVFIFLNQLDAHPQAIPIEAVDSLFCLLGDVETSLDELGEIEYTMRPEHLFPRKEDEQILDPVTKIRRRFGISLGVKFPRKGSHPGDPAVGASAGELIYISTLIRIREAAQNSTLFLVDEPESNLHPEWQASFCQSARTILSSSKGCAMVIATHSPFVVHQSNTIFRLNPKNEPRKVTIDMRKVTVNEVLFQCFSTSLYANKEIEPSVKILIDYLAHPGNTPPTRTVREAADHLRGIPGDASPELSKLIREFDFRNSNR